jgi:hypothetical protein
MRHHQTCAKGEKQSSLLLIFAPRRMLLPPKHGGKNLSFEVWFNCEASVPCSVLPFLKKTGSRGNEAGRAKY